MGPNHHPKGSVSPITVDAAYSDMNFAVLLPHKNLLVVKQRHVARRDSNKSHPKDYLRGRNLNLKVVF